MTATNDGYNKHDTYRHDGCGSIEIAKGGKKATSQIVERPPAPAPLRAAVAVVAEAPAKPEPPSR